MADLHLTILKLQLKFDLDSEIFDSIPTQAWYLYHLPLPRSFTFNLSFAIFIDYVKKNWNWFLEKMFSSINIAERIKFSRRYLVCMVFQGPKNTLIHFAVVLVECFVAKCVLQHEIFSISNCHYFIIGIIRVSLLMQMNGFVVNKLIRLNIILSPNNFFNIQYFDCSK